MKNLRAAAALTALLPLAAVGAGALDPAFGSAGRALFDFTPQAGRGEIGSGLAITQDQKLIVLTEIANDTPARVVVSRHLTDGSLDPSFGTSGRVALDFGACAACAVTSPSLVLLPNGSIIVGATEAVATITVTNRVRNMAVTRLTAAGAIDTSFGVGGVARVNPEGSSILHDIAVQADGALLLAGSTGPSFLNIAAPPAVPQPAPAHWLVARLTASGAADTSFTDRAWSLTDLAAPSVAQRIGVQSTGDIVVIGKSVAGLRGYRYGATGTVMTFMTSAEGDFSDLAIDSQDRPWVLSTGTWGSRLMRFTADLSGNGGWQSPELPGDRYFASVLPMPNGEAYLSGGQGFVAPQGAQLVIGGTIVKLDSLGRLDTGFGDNGSLTVDRTYANRLAAHPNGRVVGAGMNDATATSTGARLALMRIDPTSTSFVSREWLGFPIQSLGTRSGTQVVTVTNTSGAARNVSVSAPANFEVTGCSGAVAAGSTCAVSITHRPTATSVPFSFMDYETSAVTISDNGGRQATLQVYAGVEKSLVQHYYRSILRRDADIGGWDFWNSEARRVRSDIDALSGAANSNTAEAWYAMAIAFYGSGEYAALASNNDAFITDLYRTFFDRAPDTDGMNYWRSQIASGVPRDVILLAFMFSPEFAGFNASFFGGATNRPEIDLVMDMYRGLLGRLPDSYGMHYWVQRMQAAQCQGATAVRAEADGFSAMFAGSAEYSGRGRTPSQYAADLYNAILRRAGDAGGFQYWKNSLETGAVSRDDARRAFLASPEFTARVQAVIAAGCKG